MRAHTYLRSSASCVCGFVAGGPALHVARNTRVAGTRKRHRPTAAAHPIATMFLRPTRRAKSATSSADTEADRGFSTNCVCVACMLCGVSRLDKVFQLVDLILHVWLCLRGPSQNNCPYASTTPLSHARALRKLKACGSMPSSHTTG